MPIIVKGKEFELCPAGLHQAIVREVTPFEHESWGKRVKFTFETDKIGQEGQPLCVFHEASLNLSPKAKLSGIVESIIGRPITPDERKNGFDIEALVDMNCQINVKHRFSQTGNEYAYVDAIIMDNGNQQTMPPATVEADNEASEEEAADIPF